MFCFDLPKKGYHGQITFSCLASDRPLGRQLTVDSNAGWVAAPAALYRRYRLTLYLLRLVVVPSGGGGCSRGQMHPITRQRQRVSVSIL